MNENSLKPGTVLRSPRREYTVVKELGHGGFGITYLVESRQVTAEGVSVTVQYAIKEHFVGTLCSRDPDTMRVVSSQPVSGEISRSLKAFIVESHRLEKLGIDDPNLVKVFDVFEANGTAYMVMEYLDGGSLYEYVKERGRLTMAQMEALMKPICRAVGVLHSKSVAHYDIKPHNIMLLNLKKGVYPVLIDFGLAKHYDGQGDATSAIAAAGYSLGYAPVEQYGGFKKFSPTADVYALAATMLFCLTGERPPQAQDVKSADIFNRLVSLGVKAPQAQAIAGAMEYRPEHRPANANALLQQVFGSQPQYVPQPQPQPPFVPQPQPQFAPQPQPYRPPRARSSSGWVKPVLIVLGCIVASFIALCVLGVMLTPTPEENYDLANEYLQKEDYGSAAECFRYAAEEDYAPAQWALGLCYEKGCGVGQDPYRAVYWYEKAAAANDTNAIYSLGRCYENGIGVTRDYTEAYNWYSRGAGLGSFQSQQALDDFFVAAE